MCDGTLRRTSQAAMQGVMDVAKEELWRAGGEEMSPKKAGLFHGAGGGPQENEEVQMGAAANA